MTPALPWLVSGVIAWWIVMQRSFGRWYSAEDFERSGHAARLGVSNVMPPAERATAARFSRQILDPLVAELGYRPAMTSGYRNWAVNAAADGAANSHHMHGMAADLAIPARDHDRATEILVQLHAGGVPVGEIKRYANHLHVATGPDLELLS